MNTPQPSIIDQIADERDELRDENQKLKQRIELLESTNSDVARISKERDGALMMLDLYRIKSGEHKERIDKLHARLKRFGEALCRIANADYRGNRSTESQIAAEALKSKP